MLKLLLIKKIFIILILGVGLSQCQKSPDYQKVERKVKITRNQHELYILSSVYSSNSTAPYYNDSSAKNFDYTISKYSTDFQQKTLASFKDPHQNSGGNAQYFPFYFARNINSFIFASYHEIFLFQMDKNNLSKISIPEKYLKETFGNLWNSVVLKDFSLSPDQEILGIFLGTAFEHPKSEINPIAEVELVLAMGFYDLSTRKFLSLNKIDWYDSGRELTLNPYLDKTYQQYHFLWDKSSKEVIILDENKAILMNTEGKIREAKTIPQYIVQSNFAPVIDKNYYYLEYEPKTTQIKQKPLNVWYDNFQDWPQIEHSNISQ